MKKQLLNAYGQNEVYVKKKKLCDFMPVDLHQLHQYEKLSPFKNQSCGQANPTEYL